MTQTCSMPLQFKDGVGTLHGFSTGMVKVKSKFRTAQGNALTSKLHFILDNQWTEYLPIMVWVVEHPEGIFVIDTGENAQVNEPGYFKKEGPVLNFINTKSFDFEVRPEDEVGPQLTRLGYREEEVSSVILTHLHLDHFDGLKYFKNTDVIIHQLEWEKPTFALPSLYPEWFDPIKIQLSSAKDLDLGNGFSLVESGEVSLVHTPGHTLGHCSVLIKTDELHYLLAGDVTYDQQQLAGEVNAGGHQSFKSSKKTYRAIKRYASKHRLVYLPSHDRESLTRLMRNQHLNIE